MRRRAPMLGIAVAALLAASVAASSNEPGHGEAPAKDAHGKKAKPEGGAHGKEKSAGEGHAKEPPPPRVGCYYDPNAKPPLAVHPPGDAHGEGAKPANAEPDAHGAPKAEHGAADTHGADGKGEHAPEAEAEKKAVPEPHAAEAKPDHAAANTHGAEAKGEHATEATAEEKAAPEPHAAEAKPDHAAANTHGVEAKGEHTPEAAAEAKATSEPHEAAAKPEHADSHDAAKAEPPVPATVGKHAKNAATPIDDAPRYPAVPDTESTPPEPIHAASAEPSDTAPAKPSHAASPEPGHAAPTVTAEAAHPIAAAEQHGAAPEPAAPKSETAHPAAASHDTAPTAAPTADAKPEPAPAPPAMAENDPDQPYALIRTLESVQDRIASGSADAHVYQRTLIADIAKKLPKVTDEQWRQPRNSRAAIIYALSGGDPGVLAKLLSLSPVPCVDESLIRGLLDYSQGRNPEALELLSKIDARTLDPRAGGHLALAQALLVAAEDPKRAMGYLDQARLLAPGTLVEEAALRREMVVAATSGELEMFRSLTSQYLRRYNKSFYATDFIRRFATVVTTGKYAESPALFQSLAETLDSLAPEQRKFAYSAIAEASIVRGEVQLTLLAAKKLADHAKDDPKRGVQARLYEAAALLVTDDYERAAAQLKGIGRAELGARDQPLLDAALALSVRLRAPPAPATEEPPPVSAEQGKDAELSKMPDVIDKAKKAFGKTDELLDGDRR